MITVAGPPERHDHGWLAIGVAGCYLWGRCDIPRLRCARGYAYPDAAADRRAPVRRCRTSRARQPGDRQAPGTGATRIRWTPGGRTQAPGPPQRPGTTRAAAARDRSAARGVVDAAGPRR